MKEATGVIVNCVNSIKPFISVYGTQGEGGDVIYCQTLLKNVFPLFFMGGGKKRVKKHLQQHECDIFMYIKASCGESRRKKNLKNGTDARCGT